MAKGTKAKTNGAITTSDGLITLYEDKTMLIQLADN